MARNRKSKKLHVLQGTYQKCRHEDRDELELPPGVPEMPEFLNDTAKQEWERIVPILSEYGLLAECDSAVLAVYCELFAEFRSTRSCPSAFPASKFAQFRAAYTDLGLSPTARTKIPSGKKDEGKKNPFAAGAKKQKGKTG